VKDGGSLPCWGGERKGGWREKKQESNIQKNKNENERKTNQNPELKQKRKSITQKGMKDNVFQSDMETQPSPSLTCKTSGKVHRDRENKKPKSTTLLKRVETAQ